jgi:hypothetical protein
MGASGGASGSSGKGIKDFLPTAQGIASNLMPVIPFTNVDDDIRNKIAENIPESLVSKSPAGGGTTFGDFGGNPFGELTSGGVRNTENFLAGRESFGAHADWTGPQNTSLNTKEKFEADQASKKDLTKLYTQIRTKSSPYGTLLS